MKTAEMILFRKWLLAELERHASPNYTRIDRAEKLFQELLRTCEDAKPS